MATMSYKIHNNIKAVNAKCSHVSSSTCLPGREGLRKYVLIVDEGMGFQILALAPMSTL